MRFIANVAIEPVLIEDALEFIGGSLSILQEEASRAEFFLSENNIDAEGVDVSEDTPIARVAALVLVSSAIEQMIHIFESDIIHQGLSFPKIDDFEKLGVEDE